MLRLLSRAKVLFYCHFPDQLLTKRETTLKYLYRLPIDWLEEISTGLADVVVVNSKFTASVFRQVRLGKGKQSGVREAERNEGTGRQRCLFCVAW